MGAALLHLDRLGKVESEVDGDQRVKGEREEAEPRGPNSTAPRPHSHSEWPVNEGLEQPRADGGTGPSLKKASGTPRLARAAKAPQRPCLRRPWRVCYIFMPPIAAAFSTVTVTSSFPAFSKVSVSGKLSPTFSGCLSQMQTPWLEHCLTFWLDIDRGHRAHLHNPLSLISVCS